MSPYRIAASLAWVALAGAGCTDPEVCNGRGGENQTPGVVTYAIGASSGSSYSTTLTVYDYTEACNYSNETFLVSLGSCQLYVDLDQGPIAGNRYFPGSVDAWASVESGQTCSLALGGQTLTLVADTGTVAFADGVAFFVLSGSVNSSEAINLEFEATASSSDF